ncbi:hypothetical protein U27_00807 [Candidatus Vecturithrix granuli]|uniref:Uncharacterized protein n=1 Tax=Vecturithrix granuli TaxID=1499967 RepID=A0A081C8K4_VECG1|nr:hypothetical protein U27_00807 [Candidatus Vecturithrix granuli]
MSQGSPDVCSAKLQFRGCQRMRETGVSHYIFSGCQRMRETGVSRYIFKGGYLYETSSIT